MTKGTVGLLGTMSLGSLDILWYQPKERHYWRLWLFL